MVFADLNLIKPASKFYYNRDWSKYEPALLNEILCNTNLTFENDTVQEYWNTFENTLIKIVDEIAPLKQFCNDSSFNSKLPCPIKNKINRRKRLLRKNSISNSISRSAEIKNLNKEIKAHFFKNKIHLIKKQTNMGKPEGLWKAVKIAKNEPCNNLPAILTLNNIPVNDTDLPNAFSDYFHNKINTMRQNLAICPNVYNGKCKLIVDSKFFMSESDVDLAMSTLKSKNCEGFDRIPVKILYDARVILKKTLAALFEKIYHENTIPEQWKIAKITPIFKKGSKNKIENYRPIANLCSASKVFEKLILNQIGYLEKTNKLDLTGIQQHGFKKSKSTTTAAQLLQSIISRATDENNFVIMASLDLSAAFDLVNVELLIKRLRVMGLPIDLVKMISIWLTDRKQYVEISGLSSAILDLDSGTVQGSILGPLLYAIFVSPLFDLANLTNFADDNFIVGWNKLLPALIDDMEKTLEMIIKWLKDSGLEVNEGKTEVCLFHRNDQPLITIKLLGNSVKTKKSMNVLGVLFDSKLTWGPHVAHAICKANKSLYAIRLIKKYFTAEQIKTLLTAYYYSSLYYNSEVWLSPFLSSEIRTQLLSASAKALQTSLNVYNPYISHIKIHNQFKQAMPKQMSLYKLSLQLHKLYNQNENTYEWVHFASQIIITSRQTKFENIKRNNYKIGLNTLTNKLSCLNKLIDLKTLDLSFASYKREMKIKFAI